LVITLLTDFGTYGPYSGAMKGVILGINPNAVVVDITHDIAPMAVEEAAFVLDSACRYFPAGTVHVVVVDPGVGTDRALLAVKAGQHIFLAPDNGVLGLVFERHPDACVYRITNRKYARDSVSKTFHGRDILAPAAAHVSLGVSPASLGEPFPLFKKGRGQKATAVGNRIEGRIVFIDRFGNGITDIGQELLKGREAIRVDVEGMAMKRFVGSYGDACPDEPVALIGSGDTLEISVNGGNARDRIGFKVGTLVKVFLK
jgi:S-adenosylmethionine hydrolase